MEFSEEEIYSLALEGNEDAKNALYQKYEYIVAIELKKYQRSALQHNIDMNELKQEAYLALSDALNTYRDDKNASLSTFISMCVERKIQKVLRSSSGEKANFLSSAYSLDYEYNEDGLFLKDMIRDEKNDPLNKLTGKEDYEELKKQIINSLSISEQEVYQYLMNGYDYQQIAKLIHKNPKQVDNTIQRIKKKIREITKKD